MNTTASNAKFSKEDSKELVRDDTLNDFGFATSIGDSSFKDISNSGHLALVALRDN
jgi:hypothetical protein